MIVVLSKTSPTGYSKTQGRFELFPIAQLTAGSIIGLNTQPSKYVLGRRDEAMREAALFIATTPNFTIAHWSAAQPARDMETVQRLAEGYRMAGLPE
ncbi:hypothetical protein ASD52_23595 [Ensifer sp. Root142]|uniref:hypothetical protein n=1 Tax=Ensifer TaxID=106591 RepID=UPI00070E65FA|nr:MULTISPECIES: hypothetical protein [Ensifer]KQY76981.1 hypothetical protein ASD52_23595 [Ensifer sp. Root142]